MVVQNIGAAEKFQEQTGGAVRMVSSRGREHSQNRFADFLAQSDAKRYLTLPQTNWYQFYGHRAMEPGGLREGRRQRGGASVGWTRQWPKTEDAQW